MQEDLQLFLQRPLIPESIERDMRMVRVLFENGLISAGLAAKYLTELADDLRKFQEHQRILARKDNIT